MRVNGVAVQFSRLFLERCADCGQIMLYGKTCLGPFHKAYIPAFAEGR